MTRTHKREEPEIRCVGCGCTDSLPCLGGPRGRCWWTVADEETGEGLCSECAAIARPWICRDCGHLQLQTDNELAGGGFANCSNPLCEGDNIARAGELQRITVDIWINAALVRVDHRLCRQARLVAKKVAG